MFKQKSIQLISMCLAIGILFSATGIVQASISSSKCSTPWIPLEDQNMEQIEGGFSMIGILVYRAIEELCYEIWNGYEINQEPVGEQPFNEAVECPEGSTLEYEHQVKQLIHFNIYSCGDPNQPIVYNVIEE